MAYNTIQIKYSATNPDVPELLPGELAYSQAGNNLFIGSPDGISGTVRIGGVYNDGILTANQALVANSSGGINVLYSTNVYSNYANLYWVHAQVVNTHISHADISFIDNLSANALSANSINVNSLSTAVINTNIITANSANINTIFADDINVNIISAVSINTNTVGAGVIFANNSHGNIGDILYSSGNSGNTYWGPLALDSTVVNTSGNFALAGNITFNNYVTTTGHLVVNNITIEHSTANQISANQISANQFNITGAIVDVNGNTGTNVSYLASTGANTVEWKTIRPPYYYTTEMHDYTEFGIGWMNVAPNQNAETLGFRSDVEIPFGAIWILAINDGLVDEPPITIYSPSTRTTPMLWMSIDGTGPYDPDTNPNGQAYWFNITPPPSGG